MAIIIILTHMTIFVKYIHQKSKIKGYKEYKNANLLIHLKSKESELFSSHQKFSSNHYLPVRFDSYLVKKVMNMGHQFQ